MEGISEWLIFQNHQLVNEKTAHMEVSLALVAGTLLFFLFFIFFAMDRGAPENSSATSLRPASLITRIPFTT